MHRGQHRADSRAEPGHLRETRTTVLIWTRVGNLPEQITPAAHPSRRHGRQRCCAERLPLQGAPYTRTSPSESPAERRMASRCSGDRSCADSSPPYLVGARGAGLRRCRVRLASGGTWCSVLDPIPWVSVHRPIDTRPDSPVYESRSLAPHALRGPLPRSSSSQMTISSYEVSALECKLARTAQRCAEDASGDRSASRQAGSLPS